MSCILSFPLVCPIPVCAALSIAGYPQHLCHVAQTLNWYSFIPLGERGTVRVKCLVQEHMSSQYPQPGHEPGSLDPRIRKRLAIFHADLYIIRPVTMMKRSSLIANILQFFSKDVRFWPDDSGRQWSFFVFVPYMRFA